MSKEEAKKLRKEYVEDCKENPSDKFLQDMKNVYILEQGGKDVFEYNIYGCPSDMDVKIGDFTQSKLEVN
jgi:uncharacterized protein YnzC (UPF0291/DUF896 family)